MQVIVANPLKKAKELQLATLETVYFVVRGTRVRSAFSEPSPLRGVGDEQQISNYTRIQKFSLS